MPNSQATIALIEDNGLNRGTVGSGLRVSEQGNSVTHQTTITFNATSIAMTDHTTAGSQGSKDIYTFPVGLIRVLGVRANLALARVGTAIGATAAVVASIGTAAAGAGDAALTGTEADIHGSTAAPLTAGAGTFTGVLNDAVTALTDSTTGTADNTLADVGGSFSQATLNNNFADLAAKVNALLAILTGRSVVLDGTSAAKTAKLNLAIPDAGSSGNDALTATGTIVITWQHLGT